MYVKGNLLTGKVSNDKVRVEEKTYFYPVRDLFRGWGAQGFPTPEVDFPSLEFQKCIYIENSTKALEYVQLPPPKEPVIDNDIVY